MTLRPGKWILYSPVAALPLLAALATKGESPGSGFLDVGQTNWVWLLAALGLGIWFGWATGVSKGAA